MDGEPEAAQPAGAPRRRRGGLKRRLLLSAGSLATILLLLEVVARVFDPALPPQELRSGLYAMPLPLLNGRPNMRWSLEPNPEAKLLARAKEPGELRVFTFGESSMEGCPWGHLAGPAAFLQERLGGMLPDRRVTVVNMGKTSSFVMDSYYYLVEALRYSPDYVVFYQGNNDRFDLGDEMCRVATAPVVHGTWRWLVERSKLLWVVRTFGPEAYMSLSGSIEESREQSRAMGDYLCDPEEAFEAWTEALVSTALAAGARPVVVSYVRNSLADFANTGGPEEWSPGDPEKVFRCPLDPECSPLSLVRGDRSVEEWTEEIEDSPIGTRNGSWRRAVEGNEGLFLDFRTLARELPEAGAWLPPLFLDGVHLSVAGYAILGEQMAATISAAERGEAVPEAGYWPLSPSPAEHYEAVRQRTLALVSQCEVLLKHAADYFRAGSPLFAGYMWRTAADLCPTDRVLPGMKSYERYVNKRFGKP